MTKKSIAWFFMALLAVAVAGYAFALALVDGFRPPFARILFEQKPLATYAHFLGGGIALAVGAVQLNTRLRTRFLGVHRWLGRVYLIAVLASGVAGLFMAVTSSGTLVSSTGFGLLAVLWLGITANAYRHIRQRNINAHKDWMIRSYALTFAAVTLRIYLPSAQIGGMSMAIAYPAVAWLCWVPNLLIAEWIVRAKGNPVIANGEGLEGAAVSR